MAKRQAAKPASRTNLASSRRSPKRASPKTGRKTVPKPKRQSNDRLDKVKKAPLILADDIPDRVQLEYRELLAQGFREREATSQLAQRWKKLLTSKALRDEFLLALAGTQWRMGRLEPAIKKEALAIIDRVVKAKPKRKAAENDAALHRRQALLSLREILTSPPPAKKEIRLSKAPSSDADPWLVGALFAYKLLSGRYVVFHVVACLGDKSAGFWPVFALLDWIGSELPAAAQLRKLPLKTDPHSASDAVWMVSAIKRHPSDFSPERIEWLDAEREPHAQNIDRGFAITYWKEKLDEKLRFDFGWE
ncbi:MAG TPA: hypothetical protein VMP01_21220 [Pirellulaceae bacterium]|nr:hypothetical protein [Pirellulaceae bacterium]